MAIVTFLGSGKEQVGKTLAVVATATNIAIEQNKKILVISISQSNDTMKNCYWDEEVAKKTSIFRPAKGGAALDNGIEGLAKMIISNKIAPNLITNYTKIVFKDRLEILLGFKPETLKEEEITEEEASKIYLEIVKLANQYYDMVLVDLDNEINQAEINEILKRSDVIVTMSSQKMSSIKEMRQKKEEFPKNKTMLLIGKYDRNSKYTLKNITRTLGEKKELLAIPYSTLYFEAAQEGTVTDLFLKLRRIEDKNDENAFFIEMVKKVSEQIITIIENNKIIR